jgi:uncharacterized membrane protein
MNDKQLRVLASAGLAVGGVLGMAGTFALLLISGPRVFPSLVRILGLVASAMLVAMAVQIYAGVALLPITAPLPFSAYPVFVATLFGWIWTLLSH